jgi:hypothetical protein
MPSYSGVFTLQAQMQAVAANNWPSPPLVIGEAFGGGFFAGQISTAGNGIADYNLVVGPIASAKSTLQWKTTNSSTAGTSSVIDGPTNSANMNNASHPCAQFCEGLTIGGFSDWYMPAQNELEVCYYNLKPTTTANNTSWGINPNAVPARASTYTSGTPAQTSATAFKNPSGAEKFSAGSYWSSSQSVYYSGAYGRMIIFDYGEPRYRNKTTSYYVRAVRRVAV